MKKYFLSFGLLLTVSLATVVFNSCGKDDDSGNGSNNYYSDGKRISKFLFYGYPKSEINLGQPSYEWNFSYDDNGRISKYTEDNRVYDYTYKSDMIEVRRSGEDKDDYRYSTYLLNEKGFVKDDGGVYTYNNNNEMIKVVNTHKGVNTTNIVWASGNMIRVEEGKYYCTIEYTDKENKAGVSEFLIRPGLQFGLPFGKRTKNLPLRIEEDNGYSNTVAIFDYEFDGDGYVTKIITRGNGYNGHPKPDYKNPILIFEYE